MDSDRLTGFCEARGLPGSFRPTAAVYARLARWLIESPWREGPLVVGVCGAQGTGKSTLAEFLAAELKDAADWSVAVLSLDDFYLSRAERLELSREVHPLLATRGPPGTHDCAMMGRCIRRLRSLGHGKSMALPRFDKARDDRAPTAAWPRAVGVLDAIVLEGWCLGVPAQDDADLPAPVNELERRRDGDARWRTYVNDRLRDDYAPVFSQLDRLIFLQAPDMRSVLRWRGEQERKLIAATPAQGPGILSERQLREFVQHFERLSRVAMAKLPAISDVTVELDASHQVRAVRSRVTQPNF